MNYQTTIIIIVLCIINGSSFCNAVTLKVCSETNISCMTFGKLLENYSVLQNNVTLEFEQSVHVVPVNVSWMYVFENVTNFTMKGIDSESATIDCANRASFGFINITVLNIFGIKFERCGVEITDRIMHRINSTVNLPLTIDPGLRVGIFVMNVKDLNFYEVSVKDSTGYGIIGINVLGQSKIRKSIIDRSNYEVKKKYLTKTFNCRKDSARCNGGNVLFIYTNFLHDIWPNCDSELPAELRNVSLIISNTNMSEGNNYYISDFGNAQGVAYRPTSGIKNLVSGGGMSLTLLQTSFPVNFMYTDSLLSSNAGFSGGNIYISIYSYSMSSKITIENLVLLLGNTLSSNKVSNPYNLPTPHYSGSGGGIYYEYGNYFRVSSNSSDSSCGKFRHLKYNIIFDKLQLIHNHALYGAGVCIKLHLSEVDNYQRINHNLIIGNSIFNANRGFFGVGLYINELQDKLIHPDAKTTNHCIPADEAFTTKLKNSIFTKQSTFKLYDTTFARKGDLESGSVIFLSSVQDTLTVQDVTVIQNRHCTGMLLMDSSIHCTKLLNITGNHNLANSNGGGGIAFIGRSYFTLHPNTMVIVSKNHARYLGGGIYIPSIQHYHFQPMCFFQVLPKSKVKYIDDINDYNASIKVFDNKATYGWNIYGGDLETCFLSFWDVDSIKAYNLFVETGNNTPTAPSRISSYANTICFCTKDERMNCDKRMKKVKAFPGQKFSIKVTPVGQLNGVTKSDGVKAIFSSNLDKYKNVSINLLPESNDKVGSSSCNTLSFTISLARKDFCSNSLSYSFNLIVQGVVEEYYWKKVQVEIQPCPSIYYNSLNSNTWKCTCMKILQKNGFECHNELIKKTEASAPTSYAGSRKNCIYVHRYCQPDYCNTSNINIYLNSNHQCINNRKGIMCGKCVDGYSLVLGSNRCVKCGNINLLLILAFIVIGILLVWSISFLNLSTSTGLINGIIFYANIVKINKDILYSSLSDDNPLVLLLAWLNLDFGFEVCLFNGMNEFYKTLLQFAFPIYLWLLSCFLIYMSRHYRITTKVFGRHSTQALATILLMSFTKLLNVVFKIFSPTQLHYECNDGKTGSKFVWWSDGTMSYGKNSYHIILLAIALLTTIFGIIPYFMLLVSSPCLQRMNHHKIFQKIAKIKPFLDAYEGPYNNSSQYWTGLLLIVRLGLITAFAFNVHGYPQLQLLLIIVTCTTLLFFTLTGKGIYRVHMLNNFEAIVLINLTLYVAIFQTILSLPNDEDKKSLYKKYTAYVSLSVFTTHFLIVVCYCALTRVLNACGIPLAENKFKKSIIIAACCIENLTTKHSSRETFIKRKISKRYMKNYNKLSDNQSNSYSDTDEEDMWRKSVDEYREPLLSHLSH